MTPDRLGFIPVTFNPQPRTEHNVISEVIEEEGGDG